MSSDKIQHEFDEDGDHDPDECQKCLEENHSVVCDCSCGDCCRGLIIETTVQDAVREPLIAKLGSRLRGFDDETLGYMLNHGVNHHCVFLDEESNRCTIWGTRPAVCRLFDCDDHESNQ